MRGKYLVFAAFLGLVSSCALIQVSSDYDESMDFARYQSFAFYKAGMEKLKVNDLDKQHILYHIREGLKAKGMRYAKKPDVYVNVWLKTRDKVGIVTEVYPYAWSSWWGCPWGWGITWMHVETRPYRLGLLYIDLIDAKTQKLVWEGKSVQEAPSDLSERAGYFKQAIRGILSQYPPKSGKKR